jgi:hypothetical protein
MGACRTVVRMQAWRRWGLVLAVVVLLCSVPIVLRLWPARATGVGVAALRDRIAASAGQPYQGFVQSNGLLGLPSLPDLEQVSALVSGTTQMRVWYAARDRWRVDVIDGGAESDLYQTPGAQYAWDYGENQLARIVGAQPVRLPRAADMTPPDLARRLLAVATGDRIGPLAGKRVAGIAAAGLRLVPATAGTTISHVDIWAERDTGLPLQVEITARGGERPVFVTRFLEVHRSVPGAAVLTPPARHPGMGYTVTDTPDVLSVLNRWTFGRMLPDRLAGYPRRDLLAGASAVGVYGVGLARFVVLAVPGRFGSEAYDEVGAVGQRLTLPNGTGVLLPTGLLSVLVVRAGRTYLVAGLVDAAVLKRAAIDLSGAT